MKTPEKIAKKQLKTFDIADVRSWNLSHDPSLYLPEGWSGTVIDWMKIDAMPAYDRLRMVWREPLLSEKTLRRFAVWCVRQVEHLLTYAESKSAIEVAERFACGNATTEELTAARIIAGAVREAAACDINGAGDAAGDAAWAAAFAASSVADENAGWAAARAAAWAATAVADIACADGNSDWTSARNAALESQIVQLLKMLEDEIIGD